MQRAVLDVHRGGKIEAAGKLGDHAARRVGGGRPVFPEGAVERFRLDVLVREKRRRAGDTGGNRRDDARMTEVSRDQPLEVGHQLPRAIGRKVRRKQLDGQNAVALRVVGTIDRPERPGTDLMQHAKWTQRLGGRIAGSVRVQ